MSENQIQQESLAAGGGGNSTTGYASGTTCTISGTYRASNKYMDIIMAFCEGEIFLPFVDGKKTTWYALTPTLSTNQNGEFKSVKVAPGTI
jgi:hypothetical protein